MRRRPFVSRLIGIALAILGSVIWTARLDFYPERILKARLGNRLVEVLPGKVHDLSEVCGQVSEANGWVLFVMNANLISDSRFRTYFETAEERVGLWVEYDPGLLRLGMGLGPENVESNTEIPIRWVRRDEVATILISVTPNETRVLTNVVDKKKMWPGDFVSGWRCNAVQIGDDLRELSEGNTCVGCSVKLRYATGSDAAEITGLFESASNIRSFNTRRILGSALTMLGVVIMVFPLTIPRQLNTFRRTKGREREARFEA